MMAHAILRGALNAWSYSNNSSKIIMRLCSADIESASEDIFLL